MAIIEVKTQAELDQALQSAKETDRILIKGEGWFTIRESSHVEAWESSHVVAWESSHVVAWESSHVEARESSHVEAWESSHVVARGSSHVEARESSHVEAWESSHVVARGSSHVVARESSHVVAWESSHVVAWESSVTKASKQVAITVFGETPSVTGGVQIKYQPPLTAQDWCEEYGVEVNDGIAILFKGVNDDFTSNGHKQSTLNVEPVSYAPGTTPSATDWDGGAQECGRGLHFSPHPQFVHEFHNSPAHYVACPVRLDEIAVHPQGSYPQKVKAPRVCAPIWEVDQYGKKIEKKRL